ncbi:MAG TPA: NAD(P)/FAD-dependent oxidoreductase [Gaiellaceae bacterium]|nr:NAD(P)/FAD-dependent oxidoreductase [Gaiellaceae bacterium]
MARTLLARGLQSAAGTIAEASARRISVEQVLEERRTTRSRFVRDAGVAAIGLTAFGKLASPARGAGAPRIAIVGAGLAGLSAAYSLRQAGYTADVYEGSDRIGGRCWTLRGAFPDGQIVEHGGELIDQSHGAIRNMAQGLGLKLDNLLQAEQNGTELMGYFDGKPYSYAEMTDDLKAAWQKIHKDVSAASYPTTFEISTERGRELDRLSIVDWIEETFEGGIRSRIGQLLDVAYNIEYGGESSVQSSLNLLYLLGYSGQGQFRVFGPSNEKYHVAGGNDQITDRLAERLPGQIRTGMELTAVKLNSSGGYSLTFAQASGTTTVTADRVVLAIPFSILRSSVDITRAGFEKLKLTAIREQGMGTNSKLHVGFKSRFWRALGSNGDTFSDTGYQNTWEVSRGQAGANGILVDYTGGNIGASFGSGTPAERAKQFLAQLEPVLQGATKQWNGRAEIDFWPGNRWAKGSYSYWKVGQYTKFAGMEGRRQGNCHFAGEHTSIDFQGYLNGAVETGQRAAAEILADYK